MHEITESPISIASSHVYDPEFFRNLIFPASLVGHMEQKELFNEHRQAGMASQACNPNFQGSLTRGL